MPKLIILKNIEKVFGEKLIKKLKTTKSWCLCKVFLLNHQKISGFSANLLKKLALKNDHKVRGDHKIRGDYIIFFGSTQSLNCWLETKPKASADSFNVVPS